MGIVGGVLLALWMTPAVGRLALEQFGGVANREVAVSWRVIGVVAMVAVGLRGDLRIAAGRSWRHDAMLSTCCVAAPRRRRVS